MLSLSLIGFLTILIIVILLIRGNITPFVALVIVPIIGAFIAGVGFGENGEFFNKGMYSVISIVILLIFAILFFVIILDVGHFDPLICNMVTFSRGNVITVSVSTVFIAAIVQLDGSGASTFLITIPAYLRRYGRFKRFPYLLLLL